MAVAVARRRHFVPRGRAAARACGRHGGPRRQHAGRDFRSLLGSGGRLSGPSESPPQTARERRLRPGLEPAALPGRQCWGRRRDSGPVPGKAAPQRLRSSLSPALKVRQAEEAPSAGGKYAAASAMATTNLMGTLKAAEKKQNKFTRLRGRRHETARSDGRSSAGTRVLNVL